MSEEIENNQLNIELENLEIIELGIESEENNPNTELISVQSSIKDSTEKTRRSST